MRKLKTLLLFLCVSEIIFAQSVNKNSDTSINKTDSLIENIQQNLTDNLPTISLDENDLSESSSQNISSLLTSGRDVFLNAAAFNFNTVRFRLRGYDADLSSVYINGVSMDNLDNGFTPFGLWSGLNDAFRNVDVSLGLRYNTFSFGDIGTTTNIDARASKQRKQTSFSYAISNRSYENRIMFTHSTGLNKKGFAFTFSASRRWANEGYAAGTYYNGWSYFVGVDKKFDDKNLLSFIAFAAPTENGRQGASVMEMMNLAGTHYYNPYWGYQNGQKRNASVSKINQPVIILTHDLRMNNNTTLITAASFSFGDKSLSALDWYNAPDPRPDYYGYLPSAYKDDVYQQQQLQQLMSSDENLRQINWQNLYNINRDNFETIHNVDGISGNDVSGHRSLCILTNNVVNMQRFNLNSVLNSRISNHLNFTSGISFQSQKNHYYQQVNDLLGGDFYVDLNSFAVRDFPNNENAIQNNLNDPNRILHVGDHYGYDYNINITKTEGWMQTVFKFNKIDFFVAAQLSQTQFWRKGNVKNGLFPDNSFGISSLNKFMNYAVKSGITYKLNGRNYLYINTASLTRAPYFENAYTSPRTRDFLQNNLISEIIQTIEGGYILNTPKIKLRLSGYYTKFKNGFDVLTFYDDEFANFVNYALSKINKLHFGSELGFQTKITTNISLNGAASVARYYYDCRQNAIVTLDNSAAILDNQIVYSNNYRVPSTPQQAYSSGVSYRSPKYWFINLTVNYFDDMWLSFNPLRRTTEAVQGLDEKSQLYHDITDQQKLDANYTLDFFGGYSWRLPKSFKFKKTVFLVFNAGINNLLNNTNIISGGYEQLRFDFTNKDVNKFPPKYYYALGLNYFISATIRF
ncbi:MAG: TonB-dependent receptor [Chitinophagaceae bacterium]